MKKTNNKGFSLVELIVVIAIMAVLVGVLAPTFTKYVEQSRRSTDIQNAEAIKTAYLADIADGTISTDATNAEVTSSSKPSTLGSVPTIQAKFDKGSNFKVTYSVTNGTCDVFAGGYKLTDPTEANTYKTASAKKN